MSQARAIECLRSEEVAGRTLTLTSWAEGGHHWLAVEIDGSTAWASDDMTRHSATRAEAWFAGLSQGLAQSREDLAEIAIICRAKIGVEPFAAVRALVADRDETAAERDRFVKYVRDVLDIPAVHAANEEGMAPADAVYAALADAHYAEGTPLFEAEIAKREAEEERDEARADLERCQAGRLGCRENLEAADRENDRLAQRLRETSELADRMTRCALEAGHLTWKERERAEKAERDLADVLSRLGPEGSHPGQAWQTMNREMDALRARLRALGEPA